MTKVDPTAMLISVVIPAYNEEQYLHLPFPAIR